MNSLVAQIEKAKPFFEKVSRNKYLRSIRNGFMAAMPVILFSSLFILIANLPEIFGVELGENLTAWIMKPYDYTMGLIGLLVAGNTAKSLTDSFNRDLPTEHQLNNTSTSMAAMAGFVLLAADPITDGFANEHLGTSGLIVSFVIAIIASHVYKVFVTKEVTIKMPEEVPPNISQAFADIFPFAGTILIALAIDFGVRYMVGVNFAEAVIVLFQPLFSATESYIGLSFIAGAMAFFWFIGIHGPSIVEPGIIAVEYPNIDTNLRANMAGKHASKVLTNGSFSFIMNFGGTGSTFVVPYLFMFLSKSKRNKAVGQATFIPSSFSVNEPILFGAPLVLNPVFFIPFILSPMVNISIFKAFVDILGMNGFMHVLPWPLPAPISIPLGTGFDPLSFVLVIVLAVVDIAIYYPFFKVYDNQMYEEEQVGIEDGEVDSSQTDDSGVDVIDEPGAADVGVATSTSADVDETNVLVLCAGGGTSGLLANALTKGANEYSLPINATGGTYGAHDDILKEYDLVVLAPQVASNYEDIKKDTDRLGVDLVRTSGQEYIGLTKDPKGALDFVLESIDS